METFLIHLFNVKGRTLNVLTHPVHKEYNSELFAVQTFQHMERNFKSADWESYVSRHVSMLRGSYVSRHFSMLRGSYVSRHFRMLRGSYVSRHFIMLRGNYVSRHFSMLRGSYVSRHFSMLTGSYVSRHFSMLTGSFVSRHFSMLRGSYVSIDISACWEEFIYLDFITWPLDSIHNSLRGNTMLRKFVPWFNNSTPKNIDAWQDSLWNTEIYFWGKTIKY